MRERVQTAVQLLEQEQVRLLTKALTEKTLEVARVARATKGVRELELAIATLHRHAHRLYRL